MRGALKTRWFYWLPAVTLLAVTLPHLTQGDFRSETAHYGAIGLQCWTDPLPFWKLHEHPGVPYLNKPPLAFWIHGLFLKCLGINLIAARLPSILAALGCLLLTTSLTRRGLGRLAALATGICLALTYEYFRRTREISLDLWQLFFMLAAVRAWLAREDGRQGALLLAGASLGLALLCKPFMALLLPLLLLGWSGLRHPLRQSLASLGIMILVGLLVALPWHLAMAGAYGLPFINQYLGREVIDRLQGVRDHAPAWYYAVEMGRSYWPWAITAGMACWIWARRQASAHHRNTLRLAALWCLAWFLILSLFPDKRPRYALPLYPFLAVLSGYGIAAAAPLALRAWYRRGVPLTTLLVVATALLVAWLPVRVQAPPDPALTALVEWARHQPDPSRVISAALSSSDESMIFLKAGYWPTPLRFHPHPEPDCYLLYTRGLPPARPAPSRLVFQSGPYSVVAP